VHGYSRSFHFVFGAITMTKEGFIVDYGDLKELKRWLEENYDHTFVVDQDDPFIPTFQELHQAGVLRLVIQEEGPGMEGTAMRICNWTDEWLRKKTGGRAWVISVEARENDKNSSIYTNPGAGFKGWQK
jgi:6-pyruvoyltetrahydropterin/6-carboxytetrahydropterin synthase